MSRSRLGVGATFALAAGCTLLGSRGPRDDEVKAVVQKTPPAPPTAGPTYLSEVTAVSVEERGSYNDDGKYWPVRVRVKGGSKASLTGLLALTLADAATKQKAEPLEFVEEARFSKDDFGKWRVSYNYDRHGPRWRLGDVDVSSDAR
jgi:hypothetical protein